MFLTTDFLEFIITVEPLNYIFLAFGFFGVHLAVRRLILKKGF